MRKFVWIFWIVFLIAFAILYFFYPGYYNKLKSNYTGPDSPYIHVPGAD